MTDIIPKLNLDKNRVFIGSEERLSSWKTNAESKVRGLLKNYLDLDNVSFLFGAGSSMILGSTSIGNIPQKIEEAIKGYKGKEGEGQSVPYTEFIEIIKRLQNKSDVERKGDKREIAYPLEHLLDYLNALSFIISKDSKAANFEYVNTLIIIIKKGLFELCDVDSLSINATGDIKKDLENNRYHFHERLVKKILQRPLNLKRANIFTTNYDLAFEHAFDNLGVKYIDGFSGFNNRTFKPETFDYDIFYPGSTTQGRVHRIEKVIKYFKLHGSLTWIYENPSADNIYGIKEYPIKYIREKKENDTGIWGNLMIYPTAAKKNYTLDFPYSELFRQFANAITQPQSVLITYGFSFNDEHINDIIYQALSIPSFTLIVVDFNGTKGSDNIKKLNDLKDPRIIIMEGEEIGDLPFFVQNILPDLVEIENEKKLTETLKAVFGDRSTNSIGSINTESPPKI